MLAVSTSPAGGESLFSDGDLPRAFGSYTLFDRIGQGGMAQIYLARAETNFGATRLSVVKQILPAFAADPRFVEMLTYEAKLAAQLSHKNIVQVLDLGRVGPAADSPLYIAMEYVEGFDLNALLRMCTQQGVGLPVEHALGIVADMLEGLDYAHRRKGEDGTPLGIVHRDVSPSNVLISYEGEVKLCDFGIAHANTLVRDGSNEALKGKAGYMSPEHARGEAVDARSDVFAAGVILWELLAGHRLYRSRSETPLLEQARRAEIPALPELGDKVPNDAHLRSIVGCALAYSPDDRYPSAGAFLRALDEYMAASRLHASRLKLGEWIATSFGTERVARRRASEARLSNRPPPLSSEHIRAAAAQIVPESATVASAPPLAKALEAMQKSSERPAARLVSTDPFPVSDGAMRAFKRELETHPPAPATPVETSAAEVARSLELHAKQARELADAPVGESRLVIAMVVVGVLAGLVALAWALVR